MTRLKGHKYGAVRTTVDGITFASKAEAKRYGELKLLEKAKQIHGLETQPVFPLTVAHGSVGLKRLTDKFRIGEYRADFRYCTCRSHDFCEGFFVIEDVKGFDTPLSKWKRKHVSAQYGIDVRIVK